MNPVIGLLSDSETYVRAKALYALSGAIKQYQPAMDEFKAVDGYKTLVNLLKNETGMLASKGNFETFLRYFDYKEKKQSNIE